MERENSPEDRSRDESTSLADAVADPMYALDADNRFQQINDAMVEYTGYQRRDLLGRTIGEIVPLGAYERLTTELTTLVDDESRESETIETMVTTADGNVIATEVHVTVNTDDQGEYAGSVGVFRDIRDRKAREQTLELLKQVLTRVFRHNVRNELMVINGHAELLDSNVNSELQTHTTQILETADRLLAHSEKARLIEQVIEIDDATERNLSALVEEVVENARAEYPDAEITVDLPGELSVSAHPYIDRAIEELVRNAIEHAPDPETARLDIWLDSDREFQTLFIEDESGGLSQHEINVLRKGTEDILEHSSGVGLWLVRWLVEYSDSEMIVHRTEQGTLMGIRFRPRGTDSDTTTGGSPLTSAPEYVRESTPSRFRGDTVIARMETQERLVEIYEGLARTGGHAVLITGAAGVGKTTLIEQFRERLTHREEPPVIATGFCGRAERSPYWAFRQLLSSLPTDSDLPELLGDIATLSVDDTDELQQRKQVLFAEIADQLRAVATERPVVLVVEDMHWADSGTVDLFEYLLEEVGRWGHPVLFVGTCRTGELNQTAQVLEIVEETKATGRGTVLELESFDRSDVETLVSSMLDIQSVPDSFLDAIYEHTGGTPLFVNELARHLAEELGPVVSSDELPATLDDIAVPDTVESTITERLDTLPPSVRAVLELGSVLGREFSFDILRAASDRPVDLLIDCIDTLCRRQIWTRSADQIEFVHGIIRQQTLDTISGGKRTQLHERVAAAIELVHADGIEEYAAQLATHYEQAGANEKAYEYYMQAGDHARETYAHEAALDHYHRALSLSQQQEQMDDPELATTCAEIAETARTVGELDAGAETARDGLALAPNQSRIRCRLLDIQSNIQMSKGEYDPARETTTRQRELAETIGARDLEAGAIRRLGSLARRQGEFEQAQEYYQQALAIAQEIGEQTVESRILLGLGAVTHNRGRYDEAREYTEASLEIVREIGDRFQEATTLSNLGTILSTQGEYDRAAEYHEQSLDIARDLGNRHAVAKTRNSLGLVARRQGAYDRADEHYQESLRIARKRNDRKSEAYALHNLGEVALYRGATDRARESLQESLDIVREMGLTRVEVGNLTLLGRVAKIERELDAAAEYFETARTMASDADLNRWEANSTAGLGSVTRLRGEYDQARKYLDTALRTHQEIGSKSEIGETRLELGRLALDRGDASRAREQVTQARELFEELDSIHWMGRSRLLLGQIAAEAGDHEAARTHLEAALDTFQKVDTPQDELATLESLVAVCQESDETSKVHDWLQTAQTVLDDAPEVVTEQHEQWVKSFENL